MRIVTSTRHESAQFPGIRPALWLAILCVVAGSAGRLVAQTPISQDQIKQQLGLTESLSCNLRSSFPVLLFDFRMHSPYRILLPMKAVRDSDHLRIRIWTVPLKDANGNPFEPQRGPHFMANRFRMEDFAQSSNQFMQIDGSIATGAGEYRHFLSVDNGKGLGCVKEWRAKAKPSRALLPELELEPGEATDPRLTSFMRQRQVAKRENGIRVAVLLNADNRSWRRVLTDSGNMIAIAAAVRKVAEDERVLETSLTVFSLHDQTELFDQDFDATVDFRRLGYAFRQLKPGQVDLSKLSAGSEAQFLADVIRKREQRLSEADLILFVGARSPVTDKVPPAALEALRPGARARVVYLVTNPFRWRTPLNRDVIGHAVKALGGAEKEIRLPADLTKALNQAVRESLPPLEAINSQ